MKNLKNKLGTLRLLKKVKVQVKEVFLVESVLELTKRKVSQGESNRTFLKNKNMIQENIEFIEVFVKLQMTGWEQV
jgi:hypothetical protein